MKKVLSILLLSLLFIPVQSIAQGDATTVVVRAVAKDAKFIGTSMGGVYIKVTDIQSGEILAEGVTEGSTGDTDKLVRNPKKRYTDISTEGAAKFEVNLNITEPVLAKITATGPLAQKQAQVSSSTELWLIPGKDITGDGIILEIPGFAIDILQPQVHESNGNENITITANVVMMCGCPITPGGLWNSDEMEITAVIEKDGEEVSRKKMKFAGKESTFRTSFSPTESGTYNITVYGYDPRTGNSGVDKTTVRVCKLNSVRAAYFSWFRVKSSGSRSPNRMASC